MYIYISDLEHILISVSRICIYRYREYTCVYRDLEYLYKYLDL